MAKPFKCYNHGLVIAPAYCLMVNSLDYRDPLCEGCDGAADMRDRPKPKLVKVVVPPKGKNPKGFCLVAGCHKRATWRGLCRKCHRVWKKYNATAQIVPLPSMPRKKRRTAKPGKLVNVGQACIEPGCPRKAVTRKLCAKHYQRYLRDPNNIKAKPPGPTRKSRWT